MLYKRFNLEDWLNDCADEMAHDNEEASELQDQCYAVAGWLIKYGDDYTPNAVTLAAARYSADDIRYLAYNVADYFGDDFALLSDNFNYIFINQI